MNRNKLIHDINRLASRYTGIETQFKGLQQLKKNQLQKMQSKLLKAVSLKNQAQTMKEVNDNPSRGLSLEKEAFNLWSEVKQL